MQPQDTKHLQPDAVFTKPSTSLGRLRSLRRPWYVAVVVVAVVVLFTAGIAVAMYSKYAGKHVVSGKVATKPTLSQTVGTNPTTKTTAPISKNPTANPNISNTKSIIKSTGSSSGGSSKGSGTPSSPTGKVFALLDPGESNSNMQTYAAKSSVDGLAYRAVWRSLEPSAGNYNWSSVDGALAAAAGYGKMVTIHVGASSGAWPSWLTGQGAQTYTYSSPHGNVTDPIPWDSVYIQRYNQFVAALGQHISSSGKMSVVYGASADAPVSEMTIVGCANGHLTGGVAYNRTSYLNAWESTIASSATAYPGKRIYVSLPISFICQNDGNDGKAFITQLMGAESSSAPVSYFAADLNASGSTRSAQAEASLKSILGINYQTIWSYTNDTQNRMQGSLGSAVCYGWNAGGRYIEIYKADLDSGNPIVAAAIAQARTGSGC